MNQGCGEREAGIWGAWSWDMGSMKLGCGEREAGMWGA